MIRKQRAQAIIIDRGQILMARHYDHYISQYYWCFPGGGIEAGESPEQAVVRELKEETGLSVRPLQCLGVEVFPHIWQGYASTITFLAEVAQGELSLGYDPEYEGWDMPFLQEVGWRPLEGELLKQVDRFLRGFTMFEAFSPSLWVRSFARY
ncbi:RNA pyrophosphohydrolase [Chlamydia abortus]|nr:RNA pyrophosphohydrolase [Chlamydia abortus]